MKKVSLIAILLFIALASVFSDYTVSVFPENSSLESLIKENFSSVSVTDEIREFKKLETDEKELEVKVVKSSSEFYDDLLKTFDKNYLNYICDKDGIDLLFMPFAEERVKLYVYDRISQNSKLIFEAENKEEYQFPISVLSKLLPFFPHKTEKMEVTKIDPVVYEDAVNLASQIDKGRITEELNAVYKQSKKKFYQSMANSLIMIGADAVLRSYLPKDKVNMKTVNIIMQSLVLTSAADTGFRLYQYYKSGKNLVL